MKKSKINKDTDTTLNNAPKNKGKLKRFIKKHKVLTAFIAIVLVAAIVCSGILISRGSKKDASYSYVRTTTLAKGTLENSVSATGSVASSVTSSVTTSLQYTVKSVSVSVGDKVSKGDVICTLDTTQLEEQIETAENNLEKQIASAKSSYSNAESTYSSAKSAYSSANSTLSSAKSTYSSAKSEYNNIVSKLKSYQNAYDKALKNYNSALAAYVKSPTASNAKKLYGGCRAGTYDISDSSSSDSSQNGQNVSSGNGVSVTSDYSKYSRGALKKLSSAAEKLRTLKSAYGYSNAESAYTQAKTALETAQQSQEQAKDALSQAKTQLESAEDEVENASSSDELESLKSDLDDCKLTAGQDGIITALNATVGSACKDTVATIQDLSALKINITINESDINTVSTGLQCYITTDAGDETFNGTLTQIDPISSDSGSFGATVTVDDQDTDLKIGMNASVEIIVSSADGVYQVPIDAVGSDNTGSFVYRKTGGTGTDLTFEKIYVTTGEKNDYYIEISSDSLSEGDVIRSSSDLSEGIETVSNNSDDSSGSNLFSNLFGSSGGGNMPQGGTPPDSSSSGGGNMPSGGSSDSEFSAPQGGPSQGGASQ